MSLIERVAEMLGPIERPTSKSSNPSDVAAIERGLSDATEPRTFRDAREHAPHEGRDFSELKAKAAPQRPASKSTRVLKIDREQMRRQRMITPDGGRTPIAESFRRIKGQILANVANPKSRAPANLVLVTSAMSGEGKTFCAINLAMSIASEMDRTVLLVDADVAKPSIPTALGLNAEKGLLDVLLDRRMNLGDVLWNTDIGKLTFLPSGSAHQHATELLASDAMRELLQEMAERYPDRIIIFDSPPLLAASEAGVLASRMGQIVMVVEAGKTSEAELKSALGRIESNNITGLLLNKGEGFGRQSYYGGYG